VPTRLRRTRLFVVPATLVVILAGVDDPTVRPRTVPDEGAARPIVVRLGRQLAAHEEPLPPGAVVRIGSTRFRHPWPVYDSSRITVGRYYVTADPNWVITLTDRIAGRRVWFEGSGGGPKSLWDRVNLVGSPDGQRFASWNNRWGDEPDHVQLWNIGSEAAAVVSRGPKLVHPHPTMLDWTNAVVFSPMGTEIVICSRQAISVFDASNGQTIRSHRLEDEFVRDFSPRGGLFLTSMSDDLRGRINSGSFRMPVYRFRAPAADSAAEGSFRRRRRTGADDQPVLVRFRVRNLTTGELVAEIDVPSGSDGDSPSLKFSPGGRYLTTRFRTHFLVWQIDPPSEILRIGRPGGLDPDAAYFPRGSFADDDRHLVLTADGFPTRRFDLATATELAPTPAGPKEFATLRGQEGGVLPRHPVGSSLPLPLPPGYDGVVMDAVPAENIIAIGDRTGRLDVWSVDGRHVRTLAVAGPAVFGVAFSSDGRQLACCDATRRIRVWDTETWATTHSFEVPADHEFLCPNRIAFSPDGRRLLVSDHDVQALYDLGDASCLWDVAGWRMRRLSHNTVPAFTPDGRRIVGPMRSWADAATGEDSEREGTLRSEWDALRRSIPDAVEPHFYFTPRGALAAVAFGGKKIEFRRPGGEIVSTIFPPHDLSGIGQPARFSPDGRRFATFSGSRAMVWEVASGRLANVVTYPHGAIDDVHFGRDGRTLITPNHREVMVWRLTPDAPSDDLWGDLAAPEASVAERARLRLLGAADPVGFLQSRLKPAEKLDQKVVRAAAQDLDADDYRKRERAAENLRYAGRRATALLKAHEPVSVEGRERLDKLLAEFEAGPTRYELREIRAVELLEHLRTPAAVGALRELAAGDPHAVRTREAAASLGRLP
jgi:WD40 repeat protein